MRFELESGGFSADEKWLKARRADVIMSGCAVVVNALVNTPAQSIDNPRKKCYNSLKKVEKLRKYKNH